jgi:hypothetical protein
MLKTAIKSDMRLIESLCGKARRYSRREKRDIGREQLRDIQQNWIELPYLIGAGELDLNRPGLLPILRNQISIAT